MADLKQSSGVQELISKLHQEGVASGESLAQQIVADARKESLRILDEARAEADKMIADAKLEREQFIAHGNSALQLAARDAVLRVREAYFDEFQSRLKRLVQFKLEEPRFLEALILEVASKSVPSDITQRIRVLLPSSAATKAEIAQEVADVQPGSLAAFVLGLSADILRDGLTFDVTDDPSPGVKIQIAEEDVQLELTDETLTALLMQYLAPRYRAVLEKDD